MPDYITTEDIAKNFQCSPENVRHHIRKVLHQEHQWHRLDAEEARRVMVHMNRVGRPATRRGRVIFDSVPMPSLFE